jgi:hypothetical protein
VLVSVLLLAVLQTLTSSFETETWPGEGRPRFRATGSLEFRDRPESNRPVSGTLQAPINRDLEFDETRFRTVVPGVIRAAKDTSISGRNLGSIGRLSRDEYYLGRYPTDTVTVASDSRIEYLQYRAEGTCFIRIDGIVLDAGHCPADDEQAFTVVSPPNVEWWIRLTRDSQPLGWVLVDGTRVTVVGRTL